MTSRRSRPAGSPQGEIGTAWSVPPGGPRTPSPRDARAPGGVAFAGVLMLCGGLLAVLQGIAALAGDDVYVRVGSYLHGLSLTGWGALHVVLGVLAAATGAGLLRDAARARLPGVLLAALSLVAQFLFLPYEPAWSVVVIAIDVCVIRALTAGRERTDRHRSRAAHRPSCPGGAARPTPPARSCR